jgi:hypothetical protein
MTKKLLVPVLAGFMAFVIVVGSVSALILMKKEPKDSGIAVCQEMASSSTPANLDMNWRNKRLTEFGLSKHEDVRTAGTQFVDVAFRMNSELKNFTLDELTEMNDNLLNKHAVLRNACAKHGVTIPALTA